MVLEKTLESPLDCKEIQPVYPKGDQSWVFTGRADVEAETLILWAPDVKSWLIEKYFDTGKDRRQKEKGASSISNLMYMNLSKPPGDCEVQGCLVCCSSWDCKGCDTT